MPRWPAKKDPNEDPLKDDATDVSEGSGGNAPGQLQELTGRLGELEQLLHQTNQQVLDYLIHRESQANLDSADDGAVGTLTKKIDALVERLDRLAAAAETDKAPAAGPVTSSDWQRIIFGSELAEHPKLEFQRQQLLNGLMEGDPGAGSLIGQLLVFRSAMSERMPPLLKEIGEAYYRWQPKTRPGPNNMEEVLVNWLQQTMQEAGIYNTIELVHPGQRFDSARHSATTRGVEITEVRGWIVLRDNGKVYTKAGVVVT